jgi:hypothetical protein
MYKLIFFILCSMTATSLVAQESFSKISLSGFMVYLTQSNRFCIEISTDIETERTVEDGKLYIGVVDQTGSIPKGSIYISIDKLSYLELHNSKLVMETSVTVDTLNVELISSFGTLNVNANSLSISVGAGSQFSVEGNTKQLTGEVGGASSLSASKLIADQADLAIAGHSYLYVNAKTVTSLECDKNSHVTNFSK